MAPLSVLIAGGDDEFRELVKRHLGAGVRIVGDAADLDEAVSLATRLHPDVVLMDIAAPRLDGPEVARRIKAGNAETKVVLVTSGRAALPGLADGAAGDQQPPSPADALLAKARVVGGMLSPMGRGRRAAGHARRKPRGG